MGPNGVAAKVLERRLGGYVPHTLAGCSCSDDFAAGTRSGVLSAYRDVWTDGSLVRDEAFGTSCGGSGVFALASGSEWFPRDLGHLDLRPPGEETGVESCRLCFSVPKPLQTVQRAGLWGVVTALQASWPVHIGVDDAYVVRHVSRIVSGKNPTRPFELPVEGDFLLQINLLVEFWGRNATSCELDKVGNERADDADVVGLMLGVIDARELMLAPVKLGILWFGICIASLSSV